MHTVDIYTGLWSDYDIDDEKNGDWDGDSDGDQYMDDHYIHFPFTSEQNGSQALCRS